MLIGSHGYGFDCPLGLTLKAITVNLKRYHENMEDVQAAPGEDVSAAVALVNTRHMRGGAEIDVLSDAGAARRWLTDRGLLPRSGSSRPADGIDATDMGLVALREAVRALFAANFAGDQPRPADVARVNAALARAPLIPMLAWDDAGPRRGEQLAGAGADPVAVALARIASDAVAVLTTADGPQPAPCAAHGCIRWFLRTHAARQWCSNRCGDRVRAARHYARRRTQP